MSIKFTLSLIVLFVLGMPALVFPHAMHPACHGTTITGSSVNATVPSGNVWIDKSVAGFPVVKDESATVFQLISHGRSGALYLDGQWRNAPEIVTYLQSNHILSSDILHINIYGCEFAKGAKGRAAVAYLEAHLHVAVAASDNITGKGGDWVLEVGKAMDVLNLPQYQASLQYAPGDDFDGDGIINSIDIDDDNDGILDAVECPTCYYSEAEASKITSVTSAVPILSTNPLTNTYDGDLSTYSRNNVNTTSIASGVVMYDITPTIPVAISSVNFQMAFWYMVNAGSTFKLQGYNGTVWTDLSGAVTNSTLVDFSVANTLQPNVVYQEYRIVGITGTAYYSGVVEITLSLTGYVASAHPKATCPSNANTDFDNDGITNNFDLDSDGDGCYDAFEAGAVNSNVATVPITSVGANGLENTLETATDNGLVNYTLRYYYAKTSAYSLCSDADGDGIKDLVDIDDDNDGVLNATESPTCFYSTDDFTSGYRTNSGIIITSDLVLDPTANTPANLLNGYSAMNGETSTIDPAVKFSTTNSQDIYGKVIYKFEFPILVQLDKIYINYAANTSHFTASSTDTDNDGIPNYLDLDSDGDGCSDAYESGATNNTAANFQFTGNVGTNGLVNSLETVADNGIINYNSTYNTYAIYKFLGKCLDSDGDGIPDLVDIDDDNDGVPDATEAPTCYYTQTEAAVVTSVTTGLTVTTPIANTFDNNYTTFSTMGDAQSLSTNPVVYQITFSAPIALSSLTDTLTSTNSIFNNGATFKMQGSLDGITWSDVSNIQTAATLTVAHLVIPDTSSTAYQYYRILGLSGTTRIGSTREFIPAIVNYVPSAHPKNTCTTDTDGDGILNQLDLDSDGDGCSDAYESGATNNTTANFAFTGTMGTNGLDNSKETVADNGIINYTSTYNTYAIYKFLGLCLDSDNDGIPDLVDIDDDNDGVPDATEAPTCYYTQTEAAVVTSVTSALTVATIANTFDNNYTTSSAMTGAQALGTSPVVFQINFTQPVVLSSLTDTLTSTTSIFTNGATYKLQGSLDGSTWTDASAVQTAATLVAARLVIPDTSSTAYQYYRILGLSGTTAAGATREFIPAIVNYVSSAHPKNTCTTDTDGDGVLNQLDLDSDGDGCSDAYESGATNSTTPNFKFTGTMGTNGLDNSKETVADNGIINYTSTYNTYGIYKFLGLCLDSDGDGIPDLVDIDDDNDGILNATEAPTCYYTQAEAAVVTSVTSALTVATIANTFDNNYTTSSAMTGAQALGTSPVVFQINFTQPVVLSSLTDTLTSTTSIFTNGATYKLQGSLDGSTWTDASAVQTAATLVAARLVIPDTSSTAYQYYRILGLSGTTAAGATREFIPAIVSYVPSAHPKNTCTTDTDNDGITNNLDLDSDGDGCPDAKESGVYNQSGVTMLTGTIKNGSGGVVTTTTSGVGNAIIAGPYGNNGFANIIQSVADTNAYKFTYTYSTAIDSTNKLACSIVPTGTLSGSTICNGSPGKLTFTASAGTGPFILVINGVTYTNISSGVPFNVSVAPTTTTVYNLTSISDANNNTNP
jgi:hypothetical protein